MQNVKEIIAKNLVSLRKARKLTQQDLAEKLNYSDKAISRWEHAETLPDIETLCKICDIYGVRFEYLLQEEQPEKNNPYIIRTDIPSRIVTMCIAVCTVWIVAFVAYMYSNTIFGNNRWTLFIWAIPISCVVCQIYNKVYFMNNAFRCVMYSVGQWSTILAIYLQLLEHNIWMLFVAGVPVQAVIILTTIQRYKMGKLHIAKESK
ncbi:MAG: helix-turn-helix transcriptional regulator [Clostridia bacterium]|nr:helix-turn-helix transcriptional regulator [Clostridia bacterium]